MYDIIYFVCMLIALIPFIIFGTAAYILNVIVDLILSRRLKDKNDD